MQRTDIKEGRYLPPVIEEVGLEDLFGCIFMIKHFGIERGNFLRGQAQLQGFAWEGRGPLASVMGTAQPHSSKQLGDEPSC